MNINDLRARVTIKPLTRKQKFTIGSAVTGAVVGGSIGLTIEQADKKYGILGGRTVKKSKRVQWLDERAAMLSDKADACEDADKAKKLLDESFRLSQRAYHLEGELDAKRVAKEAKKAAKAEKKAKADAPVEEQLPTPKVRDEGWCIETIGFAVEIGMTLDNEVLVSLDDDDLDALISYDKDFASWLADPWTGWKPQYKRHAAPAWFIPGVDISINNPCLRINNSGVIVDSAYGNRPVGYEKSNSDRINAHRKHAVMVRHHQWERVKSASEFSSQAHAELDATAKEDTPKD